jgi:zinc D-Ala-D-Ala carboxypeptidase
MNAVDKSRGHERVSIHFTFDELCGNHPENWPVPEPVRAKLQTLCTSILEKVRSQFGPVKVTSAYRSETVNKKIGGSSSSQHVYGEAADIVVHHISNIELADWIAKNVFYGQIILESNNADPAGGWVHVSLPTIRAHTTKDKHGRKHTATHFTLSEKLVSVRPPADKPRRYDHVHGTFAQHVALGPSRTGHSAGVHAPPGKAR